MPEEKQKKRRLECDHGARGGGGVATSTLPRERESFFFFRLVVSVCLERKLRPPHFGPDVVSSMRSTRWRGQRGEKRSATGTKMDSLFQSLDPHLSFSLPYPLRASQPSCRLLLHRRDPRPSASATRPRGPSLREVGESRGKPFPVPWDAQSLFLPSRRERGERERSERERERERKKKLVSTFPPCSSFLHSHSFLRSSLVCSFSEKAKAKKAFPIKKSALAYHSLFSPPLVCLFSIEKQMSA